MIDRIRATAGAQVITPADGFKVAAVLPIDVVDPHDPDNLLGNTIDGKRLYFRAADADGNAITNMWMAGDQALCRSFNQAATGVSYHVENKYYWALVAGTNNDAEGNSVPEVVEVDGQMVACHYIDIYCGTGGEIPETMPTDTDGIPLWDGNPSQAAAGDEVAMLGHRVQAGEYEDGEPTADAIARQSAIVMSAYSQVDRELKPPFLAFYRGVCDLDLPSHRKTFFDARRNTLYGEFYSTTSNDEGTPIESYLSGTEFDIIYGEGAPATTHPEAEWTANEYPLHDNTLYYDTDREPASTGGRLWKWKQVAGTWQWVEVTDADTTAALEKIAQLRGEYNTYIAQNSKEITLAALKSGLLAAGITINGEYESVTINGSKTAIEGDLDVKGLITESSRFVDWWDEQFSVPTQSPSSPSAPLDPSDPSSYADTSLFIPLDLRTVKSVSVSPTARQSDGSGNPLYGATAIIALPMYADTTVNDAVAIRGHQLSGTHVTIRNAYSPFYAHWQQLQGAGKFGAVNGAVLICADPRILDADNYGAEADGVGGQSAAAIPIAGGSYGEAQAHGNIIANGRRAKFLLLMPGQSVELVSSVEQYGTDINGTYGTTPYLAWYVTGDSHQPVAARLTIEGTNGDGSAILHEATFDPTVTYIGETDPHAGAAFLAPPQMAALATGEKVEVTIVTDHGQRPHT